MTQPKPWQGTTTRHNGFSTMAFLHQLFYCLLNCSSSSTFWDCPWPFSVMALIKPFFCTRSSFEPRAFLQAWFLGASAVSVLPCAGGTTAEHALGFVGLFHMGSRLCVTDQGDTGGHCI